MLMDSFRSAAAFRPGSMPKDEPMRKQAADLPAFFTSRRVLASSSEDCCRPSGVRTQNHAPLGMAFLMASASPLETLAFSAPGVPSTVSLVLAGLILRALMLLIVLG